MFVNSLSFLSELQIVLTQYLQGFLVSQMEPCKMQGFLTVIQFSFYFKKYRGSLQHENFEKVNSHKLKLLQSYLVKEKTD